MAWSMGSAGGPGQGVGFMSMVPSGVGQRGVQRSKGTVSVPFLHTRGRDGGAECVGSGGYLRVSLILVSHPQSIPVVIIRARTRVSVSDSASTATSVTVLTRATRAPTAPFVSWASGRFSPAPPDLPLYPDTCFPFWLWLLLPPCLALTLLKHGFQVSSFLGPFHSVVAHVHAPCPLSSFWVLALSCVFIPKGAAHRFLFGPHSLTMGGSGLVGRDGLSGSYCSCS